MPPAGLDHRTARVGPYRPATGYTIPVVIEFAIGGGRSALVHCPFRGKAVPAPPKGKDVGDVIVREQGANRGAGFQPRVEGSGM